MRLKGDASVEFRFTLIVKLYKEGKKQQQIADLVQCSQAWVSRVLQRYRSKGKTGLKIKGKAPGKSSYLSKRQLERLKTMLLKGALHYHFPTDNWTRERIAALIEQQFSVHYHPAHISKLMRRLGFTLQKPQRRSFKKDEKAVQKWRSKTLPALKKKGSEGGLPLSIFR